MSRVQINTPPRGLDLNANPSGGARLYAYEAGTTTPVLIYGDPDLVTAVGYYLEADAAGAFPDAYLAPGFYKFTMTDADGATLPGWPVDRVEIGTAADVALTALAAIKTAANAILAPIRESLADFEADTILSYDDTDTTLQVVEGQAILLKDGHILTVLTSDSTLTPIYQNALPVPVKARLRGLDYPTLDALKLAISEGDDFAVGATATAAGKPYRFANDGNTALAGMTGWADVYAKRDAALGFGPCVSYETIAAVIVRQVGVSAVTKLSTGKFRVTLAEAQPDATYDVVAQNLVTPGSSAVVFANIANRTQNTFEVWTGFVTSASDAFTDHPFFAEIRRRG